MSEKTEQPTQKKLRDARNKGQVAKSQDLTTGITMLAAAGMATGVMGSAWQGMRETVRRFLELSTSDISPGAALELAGYQWATIALPSVGLLMVVATIVTFLQVGPLISFKAIAPDINKLNPVQGAKNLFSKRKVVELLKTIAKIGVVGYFVWSVLEMALRGLSALPGAELEQGSMVVGELLRILFFKVAAVVLVIGGLDFFFQRWQFTQDQKMSKDEVKREHKESDGDPHLKGERKRVHNEIVNHAVVEDTRTADALVVNPTHIAVAIRYDEDEADAPQVIAKGTEGLAQRMKEAAYQSGVPVMRDVPLARALFQLDMGEEIPEDLYEAVAAVLHAAADEREQNGDA